MYLELAEQKAEKEPMMACGCLRCLMLSLTAEMLQRKCSKQRHLLLICYIADRLIDTDIFFVPAAIDQVSGTKRAAPYGCGFPGVQSMQQFPLTTPLNSKLLFCYLFFHVGFLAHSMDSIYIEFVNTAMEIGFGWLYNHILTVRQSPNGSWSEVKVLKSNLRRARNQTTVTWNKLAKTAVIHQLQIILDPLQAQQSTSIQPARAPPSKHNQTLPVSSGMEPKEPRVV